MRRILVVSLFLSALFVSLDCARAQGVIELSKSNFITKVTDFENSTDVWKYTGDKPSIVVFYAAWCGQCKKISPVLEELARDYNGQIYIYKVDADKEKEVSKAFGIKAVPTLIFVPMKGSPTVVQGSLPKDDLVKSVNAILLKK